jgi:hypothetical protein
VRISFDSVKLLFINVWAGLHAIRDGNDKTDEFINVLSLSVVEDLI